jgi:hypothetical protein
MTYFQEILYVAAALHDNQTSYLSTGYQSNHIVSTWRTCKTSEMEGMLATLNSASSNKAGNNTGKYESF